MDPSKTRVVNGSENEEYIHGTLDIQVRVAPIRVSVRGVHFCEVGSKALPESTGICRGLAMRITFRNEQPACNIAKRSIDRWAKGVVVFSAEDWFHMADGAGKNMWCVQLVKFHVGFFYVQSVT